MPRPDDVPEATWEDWRAHRRAKRAGVSATAVDGIRKEAAKAGLTLDEAMRHALTQGWQGFRADWVKPKTGRLAPSAQHTPNMPLGAPSCQCTGCVEARSKRAAR